MTTDKKVNQILNMIKLIQDENLMILSLINLMIITTDEDKDALNNYIKLCRERQEVILSGMYEDDITTIN